MDVAMQVHRALPELVPLLDWIVEEDKVGMHPDLTSDQLVVAHAFPGVRLHDLCRVVVSDDKVLMPAQSREKFLPLALPPAKVSEMEHRILRPDTAVPVGYECFIHLLGIAERAITETDYRVVGEMGVGGEEDRHCRGI